MRPAISFPIASRIGLLLGVTLASACASPKAAVSGDSEGCRPGSDSDFLHGIDVSHHQNAIDWGSVRDAGIVFAFVKETQGTRYRDPLFDSNWAAMKRASVIRGAYDFYEAGVDPDEQREHFLAKFTLEAGDLPPVVDVETSHPGVTVQGFKRDLRRYLDGVEERLGVKAIIYTGHDFWDSHLDDSFAEHPLWISRYDTRPPVLPAGWEEWTFWQHKNNGCVDGIEGDVDLNRFRGGHAELRELLVTD